MEFGVHAQRWLRARLSADGDDPPFLLDEDGFLPADPRVEQGQLVRVEDVAGAGALVLLGEPGAGKTTAFGRLTGCSARTLPPEPGESGTVWVTGSELIDAASVRDRLTDHLAALPNASDAAPDVVDLVVVIDQLDESPLIRRLPRHVEVALTGKDIRGLRMLVACRTAEYPPALTRVLEQALGTCTVADLAPLRRQDTAELVTSIGLHPDEFLRTVIDNNAGAFASVPLTLKVLAAAYQRDPAELERGPLAIFSSGVTALVEEPDPERPPPSHTTAEHRLAIASRIAAYLLLCGQRGLWTGDLVSTGPHDVSLGAVCNGTENAGAGTFDVTVKMVEETLATALFSRTGPNRIAFAHSSFAAFLAARYLAERLKAGGYAAERQLAGVLLVSAPDEDSSSIPEYLRETAAWLLAHAPEESRWLAEADPEGLTSHSVYIGSAEIRALLVEGLLSRAMNIELVDRSWQRTRWRLSHPGFAAQIAAVLEHAAQNPSTDMAGLARCRLAVRLAQDSGLAELTDSLLDLAESSHWPTELRQSASNAAMDASPDQAIPRLRALLATLRPKTSTAEAANATRGLGASNDLQDENDPNSPRELVGTLLNLLWPAHLSFSDAIPHIQPFRRQHFLGMYRWQAVRFAENVTDENLSNLTTHIRRVLADLGIDLDERTTDFELDESEEVSHVEPVRQQRLNLSSLHEFITPIIGRVLLAADPQEHLPQIARLLTWMLRSAETSQIPAAVVVVDQHGQETSNAIALRRSLAEELVRTFVTLAAPFDSYHAYIIASHWNRMSRGLDDAHLQPGLALGARVRLLDDGDFAWALERVDHHRARGDHALAEAMGLVAGNVADLNNRTTFDLAYTRAGTPEWSHFQWAFEGVRIDGPQAKRMRASQRQPWAEADEFAVLQNTRLQAAVDGDASAFWQLVKDLAVNIDAGRYEPMSSWDLSSFPGAALWPEDRLQIQLRTAALRYIQVENDHRDTWLGTTTLDYRARAGYVALTILYDTEQLDSIPVNRWQYWVGSVLDNIGLFEGPNSARSRVILDHAARHAYDDLAEALAQRVRTRLTYAEAPCPIPDLPDTLIPQLATLAVETREALLHHITEDAYQPPAEQKPVPPGPIALPVTVAARDAALDTWANLLRQPLRAGDPAAQNDAYSALASSDNLDPDLNTLLPVSAGAALLAADPSAHWTTVQHKITSSPEFAQGLARTCATRHARPALTEELSDRALAQAYEWLAAVQAPDTEVYHVGAHWITPEDNVHDWRNTILSALSQRGTVDAVHAIHRYTDAYPTNTTLKAALVVARRAQANSTSPLRPQDVTTLLADTTRRVVHTAVQLAQVVIDTLDQIAADLHTHSNLLWDSERPPPATPNRRGKKPAAVWRPKREASLATYIAHELTLRLQRQPIIINREVVIIPTSEQDSGRRPDIMVDAKVPISNYAVDTKELKVPIEIKGTWHSQVLTAQRDQLASIYLRAAKTDAGVYLVGWYPIEHWNAPNDSGKTTARRYGPAGKLRQELGEQAGTIHNETGRRTLPYVLEIPRATKDLQAVPE